MGGPGGRNSILILDDHAQFASSLQKVLIRAGYEVSLAADESEALTRLSTGPFGLVITDCRVGRVSGLELISSIRRRRIPVKILLLTAFGGEGLGAHVEKAGADAYLEKPAKRREIVECVFRLLAAGPKGAG